MFHHIDNMFRKNGRCDRKVSPPQLSENKIGGGGITSVYRPHGNAGFGPYWRCTDFDLKRKQPGMYDGLAQHLE